MNYEGVGSESPSKKSPVKEGVDDGTLTPIEKTAPEDTNADGSKKNLFDFDFNKTLDSVKDLTGKVIDAIPFPNKDKVEKPDTEETSGYRNVNMAEDPNGSLNSIFALYGEITMKKGSIKNQRREADPALFDIEMEEDEFDEQAGLKDKNAHKSFGSFFTGKKAAAKKYETLSTKGLKLFKAEKENNKGGFMSFIKPNLKRFVGFDDSSLIVGELVEENILKVTSRTHIERLFKLFSEKENSKQITLVFFNKELNPLMPPVQKSYKVEDRDLFLKALEEEITKCGGKLKIFYNRTN